MDKNLFRIAGTELKDKIGLYGPENSILNALVQDKPYFIENPTRCVLNVQSVILEKNAMKKQKFAFNYN